MGFGSTRASRCCAPDPFEDEVKYPGVKIGARGKTVPVGSYYGYATGIVGLRLFPNPNFDEEGEKTLDAEKYYRSRIITRELCGLIASACPYSARRPTEDLLEDPKIEQGT